MSDSERILAQVLDDVIQGEVDEIPCEVGHLLAIGLRLHNECPSIKPARLKALRQRLLRDLAAEPMAGPGWLQAAAAAGRELISRLALRAAFVSAVVVVSVAVLLVVWPGWRSAVQASLSRVITAFAQVRVEQAAQPEPAPRITMAVRSYASIEEVQEAAGFALRLPSYLPTGVEFESAELFKSDGIERVLLHYTVGNLRDFGSRRGESLLIQELTRAPALEQAALQVLVGFGDTERLQVAGRPALWVRGSWNGRGAWVPTGAGGMVIVEGGDVVVLLWGAYGREENLRIAESLFE